MWRDVGLAVMFVACGRTDLGSPPARHMDEPLRGFTMSAVPMDVVVTQGGAAASIRVHVERPQGFADEIDVDVDGLPLGILANRVVLAPNVSDGVVALSASRNAKQGPGTAMSLVGTSSAGDRATLPLHVFVRGCPGCLDTTFGVKTPFVAMFEPEAIAVDRQDRIVVSGHTFKGPCGIVRLTSDGVRDTSFATNGSAVFPVACERARALVIAPTDEVTAVGESGPAANATASFVRFDSTGALDSTFGSGGVSVVQTPFGGVARLMRDVNGNVFGAGTIDQDPTHALIAKVGPTGAMDGSFGQGGRVVSTWVSAGDTSAGPVIALANAQLVVGGTVQTTQDTLIALARYESNGIIDSAFGSGGTNQSNSGALSDLMVASNGTFVVAGSGTPMGGKNAKTLFARYLTSGAVDTSFGIQGTLYLDPLMTSLSFASAIVAQGDGRVVAMGLGVDLQGEQKNDVFLVRLEPSGAYDGAFGNGGVVRLHLDTRTFAVGLALQGDGRIIVVGGYGHIADASTMYVVRYWP